MSERSHCYRCATAERERDDARAQADKAEKVIELVRQADLDAHLMANVLYNLPHRVQMDGTVLLSGEDVDQLRNLRLAWEDSSRRMRAALSALTASPSREPDVASGKDYKALYHELLYAVATKHPHETRHQTALRYITQAENRPVQACMADDASREAAKRMFVRGPSAAPTTREES